MTRDELLFADFDEAARKFLGLTDDQALWEVKGPLEIQFAFEAYKAGLSANQWVAVSERLPTAADAVPHNDEDVDGGVNEHEISVLTSLIIGGEWMTAWSIFDVKKKTWSTYAGYPVGKATKVVAWQKLPEPYQPPDDGVDEKEN